MAGQFWNPGDRETFYRVRGKGFFNPTIASVSRRSGSPKRLLLAEKRAISKELQQLKRAEVVESGTIRPRKSLHFSESSHTPTCSGLTSINAGDQCDLPLERCKRELVENVSFLEVQIASAQEHLRKLKEGEDSLKTVPSCGRVCSHCHQVGHNRSGCRGKACDSHLHYALKDKHPELMKSVSEAQNMVVTLTKNWQTAKHPLEQFMLQIQRSRGSFFAVMRPRLKRLNPIKYLNRQYLDKDLIYLHKALDNKIPDESEDWRLLHLIDSKKAMIYSPLSTGNSTPYTATVAYTGSIGPAIGLQVNHMERPPANSRFHPYF